ncbi:unnamed protein product [Schistosoma turkestanicum]|nr:unnamed protein product [Schistosoma turkestanicum]
MIIFTYTLCYLFQVIYLFFRPMIKYITRIVTGRCELSRIVANYPKGAPRTSRIENSLRNSRNHAVRNGLYLEKYADAMSYVQLVIGAKRIELKDQPKYYHIHKPISVFLTIICIASIKLTLTGN